MNTLIVLCCPCVGKTTIALKNPLFIDLDSFSINTHIVINCKKYTIFNLLNFSNKIVLTNSEKTNFEGRIILLDIEKVQEFLIKRMITRLTKKNQLNKLPNYKLVLKDHIKFVNENKNKFEVLSLNTEEELNNLENILMGIYYDKNGRYCRSK